MTNQCCGRTMETVDWGINPLSKEEWVLLICHDCDSEKIENISYYSRTCCGQRPAIRYVVTDGYAMICFDCGRVVSRHPCLCEDKLHPECPVHIDGDEQ